MYSTGMMTLSISLDYLFVTYLDIFYAFLANDFLRYTKTKFDYKPHKYFDQMMGQMGITVVKHTLSYGPERDSVERSFLLRIRG